MRLEKAAIALSGLAPESVRSMMQPPASGCDELVTNRTVIK